MFTIASSVRLQGRPAAWPAGTLVVQPEDVACDAVVLEEGALRVYQADCHGHEITLYRLEQAGSVCVLSLLSAWTGQPIAASVAAERDSRVSLLSVAKIREMLVAEPRALDLLMQGIQQRLVETSRLVQQVAFDHLEHRLIAYLLTHAAQSTLHVTHERIAAELGTSREVVSRLLKTLERKHGIKLNRGVIVLRGLSETWLTQSSGRA